MSVIILELKELFLNVVIFILKKFNSTFFLIYSQYLKKYIYLLFCYQFLGKI